MGEGGGKTQTFPLLLLGRVPAATEHWIKSPRAHSKCGTCETARRDSGTCIQLQERPEPHHAEYNIIFLLQHSQAREEICVPLSDAKIFVLLLHETGKIIMPQSPEAAARRHLFVCFFGVEK